MTQSHESTPVISLSKLKQGLPAITPAFGTALAEACSVCLAEQGHQSGLVLKIEGDFADVLTLLYFEVTEQMKRCWNDREYATEQAAYAVALLLMQQMTNLTVVERSRKGTGFDYWLGRSADTAGLPFQKVARLEVSGIRRGNRQQVRRRAKLKVAQVRPTDGVAPAYIVIIEFGQPLARIVKK